MYTYYLNQKVDLKTKLKNNSKINNIINQDNKISFNHFTYSNSLDCQEGSFVIEYR